jgi:aspartate/tyrosine/aromatic aminotransferase
MLCSVLCEDEKQAVAVKSQLQQLARPMYSNPPVHGALVVSTILSDPQLKKLWLKEVKVDYHSTILWLFFFFFNWHDIVCFSG